MKGNVFHIQRFSLQDGPGIRTVVFLKGCPLRCLWCHNPEGLISQRQIFFDNQKCIGCLACGDVCPKGCHDRLEGLHRYHRDNCISCGACADVCPSGALSIAGQEMDSEEVLENVMRDLPFYRTSGGGMTLSGGEPLMQSAFAQTLLRGAHERTINTCVESCGYIPPDTFASLLPLIDTLYFDYKATGEIHEELTGVKQERILQNLAQADAANVPTVLRCPIIPDLNLSDAHLRGIAAVADRHTCIYEIHLEPYHILGESKSRLLSIAPAYSGQQPSTAQMEELRGTVASYLHRDIPVRLL